jgi:hypothetical protein
MNAVLVKKALEKVVNANEIIEEKMGFETPEFVALTRPTGRNRKRPQHWAREYPPEGALSLKSESGLRLGNRRRPSVLRGGALH